MAAFPIDVRFTPKSGHELSAMRCPLCAKSRHSVFIEQSMRLDAKPVDGGGAEVREAVSRPQSAVSSETIAVVGPGGDLWVAPSLVCDAGQQQEAQIVEIGDRLGPDRGFYPRDVRGSTGAERFGGFPIE